MSATLNYTATARTTLGSSAAAKLRAGGQVPATISRKGQPSRHIAIDAKQASHLQANVVHLCTIQLGDEKITALRGEIAVDCLKDTIQHIDLVAVDSASEIAVEVAVVPDARECPGVKAGGIVERRLRKLKVLCKADSIPDALPLDLGKVQMGETVVASQVPLPAGVKLATNPKALVLSVVIPRAMKVEETAPAEGAAAAAPADAKAAEGAKPDAKAAEGAKPDAKAGDAKKK